MKFKKLEIVGFKSFADKTHLLIENGLTGIVGPNGCGKSNIVEALRWCMGETSAKSLRGSGMEDVIFSGTSNRPSKNIAEVNILLENNENISQFRDTPEIEVRRRIEKDKGSSYYINGKEVRARDVQILFADLSTGAHSPSMVSQGKVGSLITAKPTDRRAILEEAAGIGGLHARRHEAELRLTAAENNLKKADDIMKQIELQLKNLLKQAEEASRYKTISNDIKKNEALLTFLKIQEINKELKESQEGLNEIDDDISAVTIEKNYSTELLDNENKRIKPLRNDFAEITSKLQRLNLEYEDLFKQEQRTKEEAEKLRVDLKNTNDDLQSENININNANSNIKRLTEEKTGILEFEKTYSQIEDKTNDDFKKISDELNNEQKALETLSEKIFANIRNLETKEEINNYLKYFKNFNEDQSRILNETINNFENIRPNNIKENLRSILNAFNENSRKIENLQDVIRKDNEQLLSFNKEEAKNEFTEKTFLLKALQEKYAIFLSKYETLKNDSIKRKERIKSIDTEIDNWRNLEQNSKTKSENLLSRLKILEKELVKIQIKPSEIGEQKGFYQENIKNTEEARSKINSEIEIAENKITEINKVLTTITEKVLEAREKKVRFETLIDNHKLKINELENKVKEDFKCSIDDLLNEEDKLSIEKTNIEEIETLLKNLKDERDNMGAVNLRADDETKNLENQINKMMEDRKDLMAGILKLKSSINELNQKGREKLIDAYDKVGRKFNDVYTKLFGGGNARLELIESDDPLEAGLELLVSPPGKKLQSITLLSGGEQALTAMALIFAVFLINPAPICILDEVDAPLDDANVTRFCSLIEELTKITETKFIVITHHALTMSRMNRLYGVTMAERGVSQLVAVDLEKAEEMVA
ncbi:MAG: chromosome segregation SMC family protein [Candidatus Fonsibacter ubiquis]|jgi:chromosome segregation protein|nr:AAA family ATPase [Pseudomonadota bacterium]NCU44840.1 chromosome segregation protein SMC [Candidatus Fonsibacter ubiquis]GBL34337.1 chromosome partition protein Smc [Pelagibacterales bacterium]NCU45740.1 chromosome segregation protein SMC [Candidatus Fonsibacter ubiquis]NCU47547.1 chromosome segregation protein SMC [Candidatus Fonsibacter ubiquis]